MTSFRRSATRLRALYGLLRDPAATQRETSEAVGVPLSTLNAIKQRFERDGWYRSAWLPLPAAAGSGLVASFRRDSPSRVLSRRGVAKPDDRSAVPRSTFLGIQEGLEEFSLRLAGSGGAAKPPAAEPKLGPEDAPSEISLTWSDLRIARFFDFAAPLRVAYDLPLPPPPERPVVPNGASLTDLTDLQLRCLRLYVDSGDLADVEAARRLGAARQSVARIREGLQEKGFLRLVRVPDLRRLGLGLVVAALAEHPEGRAEDRAEGVRWVLENLPAAFLAMSDRHSLTLSLFRDPADGPRLLEPMPPRFLAGSYRHGSLATAAFHTANASFHPWFEFSAAVEDVAALALHPKLVSAEAVAEERGEAA